MASGSGVLTVRSLVLHGSECTVLKGRNHWQTNGRFWESPLRSALHIIVSCGQRLCGSEHLAVGHSHVLHACLSIQMLSLKSIRGVILACELLQSVWDGTGMDGMKARTLWNGNLMQI